MTGINDINIEISQHITTQIGVRVLPSPLWTPYGFLSICRDLFSVTGITDASLENVDNTVAILHIELLIQLQKNWEKKL